MGRQKVRLKVAAVLRMVPNLLSRDHFGRDPWYGPGCDGAKHGVGLLMSVIILVAF
jgi:hypothetical protein